MRRSFYHYVQTLKGPNTKNAETNLANHISQDIQFPKHSTEYDEVSSYLEMNVNYIESMDLFDQLWEKYCENNQ